MPNSNADVNTKMHLKIQMRLLFGCDLAGDDHANELELLGPLVLHDHETELNTNMNLMTTYLYELPLDLKCYETAHGHDSTGLW